MPGSGGRGLTDVGRCRGRTFRQGVACLRSAPSGTPPAPAGPGSRVPPQPVDRSSCSFLTTDLSAEGWCHIVATVSLTRAPSRTSGPVSRAGRRSGGTAGCAGPPRRAPRRPPRRGPPACRQPSPSPGVLARCARPGGAKVERNLGRRPTRVPQPCGGKRRGLRQWAECEQRLEQCSPARQNAPRRDASPAEGRCSSESRQHSVLGARHLGIKAER